MNLIRVLLDNFIHVIFCDFANDSDVVLIKEYCNTLTNKHVYMTHYCIMARILFYKQYSTNKHITDILQCKSHLYKFRRNYIVILKQRVYHF